MKKIISKVKKVIKKLMPSLFYKVQCPICKSRFRKFEIFGNIPRENALCLNCGSLERHRLLWLYLKAETNLFTSSNKTRLLHFAPEKVFYDNFSANKNIDYIPCDLFPEVYNYKGNIKIEKIDITSIAFPENSFDAILCNHVLEHIPNDRLAMSELYRTMKIGGWGIFLVPIQFDRKSTYEDFSITTEEGRLKAFGQSDHVRWYGLDYKDRLASAGFEVIENDYVKTFSTKDIFKFGLREEDRIYFCKKLKKSI